jgi:hypothetical protein
MVRTTAPFFSAPNGERNHRILFPGFDLQQIDQNIHHQQRQWQCRSQGLGVLARPKRPKLARQKLESEDCPGIIKPARAVIGQIRQNDASRIPIPPTSYAADRYNGA